MGMAMRAAVLALVLFVCAGRASAQGAGDVWLVSSNQNEQFAAAYFIDTETIERLDGDVRRAHVWTVFSESFPRPIAEVEAVMEADCGQHRTRTLSVTSYFRGDGARPPATNGESTDWSDVGGGATPKLAIFNFVCATRDQREDNPQLYRLEAGADRHRIAQRVFDRLAQQGR